MQTMSKDHIPATPAIRALKDNRVDFVPRPYKYEERGGTEVAARELGVDEHLRGQDYLFEAGGLLSMGQKAERVFGRKNFMEMYAVFSSPVLYRVVQATGAEVGSIEQNFVEIGPPRRRVELKVLLQRTVNPIDQSKTGITHRRLIARPDRADVDRPHALDRGRSAPRDQDQSA